MNQHDIINWLLSGDVSVQYQVHRDLLDTERKDLRDRIAHKGWGLAYLSKQRSDGHWGLKFYQPKWTSTHYTLLDLKNLAISPDINAIKDIIKKILKKERSPDGGVNPIGTVKVSDVCLNGMFLNYASYFKADGEELKPVVDFLLSQIMPDGGFNCWSNRQGAHHSSLHTTLSVLEGITEYRKNGYAYRLDELTETEATSREFILMHKLYKSDKTGEIIKKDFLRMPYPCRWKYDILKAMDNFQYSNTPWDDRMQDATQFLINKKNKQHTWNLQAPYKGQIHFEMETVGQPSRWNTLRVLRILKAYKPDLWKEYVP